MLYVRVSVVVMHYIRTQLEREVAGQVEPVAFTVRLTGSSVFEGVKQCVSSGLVTLPVPASIACITRLASNHLSVRAEHTHIQTDSGKS